MESECCKNSSSSWEDKFPVYFSFPHALQLVDKQINTRINQRDMDASEKLVLEPRAERIARYKAERRRELAERYGDLEELPSKWVRRDGKELNNPATSARGGELNSDSLGERVNGKTRDITNGVKADTSGEPNYLRRWGGRPMIISKINGSYSYKQFYYEHLLKR